MSNQRRVILKGRAMGYDNWLDMELCRDLQLEFGSGSKRELSEREKIAIARISGVDISKPFGVIWTGYTFQVVTHQKKGR